MSLPTRKVTCILRDQFGNPVAGARITFRLDRPDLYPAEGVVAPETLEGTADANGELDVDLFPNVLGITGSQYIVRAWNPDDGRRFVNGLATVPDTDCFLHEILNNDAPETIGAARAAQLAAQLAALLARSWATKTDGAVADGEYSAKYYAQAAAVDAGSIGTAVQDARDAADAAEGMRDDAQGYAQAAQDAVDGLGNSVELAEAARDAAQQSKEDAADSATQAAGYASTAGTAATNAGNAQIAADESAGRAEEMADNAADSASEASGYASTASGYANTASTAADNAADSASDAADARDAASGHASTASTAAGDAQAALDSFTDVYLGAKAADPATDNDGNALQAGAIYFKTTTPKALRVYDGSAWDNAPQGPPGDGGSAEGAAILAEANTFTNDNQFDGETYVRGGLRTAAQSREFITTLSGEAPAATLLRIGEFTFGADGQALLASGQVAMVAGDTFVVNSFSLFAQATALPDKTVKFYRDGPGADFPVDIRLFEDEASGRVVLALDTVDGGVAPSWSVTVVALGAYDLYETVSAYEELDAAGLEEVDESTDLVSNVAGTTRFHGPVTAPLLSLTGPIRGVLRTVSASAIDASTGNYFTKTASSNLTWTLTNVPPSVSWSFVLRLTDGGAYAMTWPASFKWPGGEVPTLTASGVDLISGTTDDGGTTFLCSALLDIK